MDAIPGASEALASPWAEGNRQAGNEAGGQIEAAAAADLATAPDDAVAERARKALWRLLPHTALVMVTPGSATYPVQIAAPQIVRQRLAPIDWTGLVGSQLPKETRVARLALPDVLGGLHLVGWFAKAGDCAVGLIVGEAGRLSVTPDQEQAARLTVLLAAIRLRVVESAPPPGTLAFSRAMSQERERVRLELCSRHAVIAPAHAPLGGRPRSRGRDGAGGGQGHRYGLPSSAQVAERAGRGRHDRHRPAGAGLRGAGRGTPGNAAPGPRRARRRSRRRRGRPRPGHHRPCRPPHQPGCDAGGDGPGGHREG